MSYYWLLTPLALFAGYVAIRTALQAAILLWRVAMIVAVDAAEKMSRSIVEGIVQGTEIGCFYVGRWMGVAMAPVKRRAQAARDAKDRHEQKTGWEELTSKPDNDVVLARKVLGLPEGFNDVDLESRYRNLTKRVAGEAGGTDWLMTQVNWAHDALRQPDTDGQLARKILAMPEEFSEADLSFRYRNLAKRVASDAGGTDWLMQQVNWANSVLKGKL